MRDPEERIEARVVRLPERERTVRQRPFAAVVRAPLAPVERREEHVVILVVARKQPAAARTSVHAENRRREHVVVTEEKREHMLLRVSVCIRRVSGQAQQIGVERSGLVAAAAREERRDDPPARILVLSRYPRQRDEALTILIIKRKRPRRAVVAVPAEERRLEARGVAVVERETPVTVLLRRLLVAMPSIRTIPFRNAVEMAGLAVKRKDVERILVLIVERQKQLAAVVRPPERKNVEVTVILPPDERKERERLIEPPPDERKEVDVLIPPEKREDAVLVVLRVELAKRPDEVELVIARVLPVLPILRVDRTNRQMVIRQREDRPGDRQRRLAVIGDRPEVDAILDPPGVNPR